MFAYEQCLLCLGHHPDIWIEAAAYLDQSSKILIEKGVTNFFACFVLHSCSACVKGTSSFIIQLKKKNSLTIGKLLVRLGLGIRLEIFHSIFFCKVILLREELWGVLSNLMIIC